MIGNKRHSGFADHSDESLMSLAAAENDAAFEELVIRHKQPVLNFFRRLGDYNNAEDLAQRTFIRLFKYRDKYRPKARFTTFLYLLARRTWIDHIRSKGRAREAERNLKERMELNASASVSRKDEKATRIEAALGTLSEEMRTVVVMSIYQGFKYREIAETLGIPLGTVKTRMYHAMKKLKEALNNAE